MFGFVAVSGTESYMLAIYFRKRCDMEAIESAVKLFQEGFSCSQAVLAAFSEQLGLDRSQALRIATAFGGGMARTAGTCGAVTGALMVLGLARGRIHAEDEEAREQNYELVHEFMDRFRQRQGSLICKELLGYDLSTIAGRESIRNLKLSESHCQEIVRTAAEILVAMLASASIKKTE